MTAAPNKDGIVEPKRPADRKPKADADFRVKYRNRAFTIEREALDDIELLEDLSLADAGNVQVLPALLTRLLGAEQRKKAYDLLRNKDTGRVSTSEATEFVAELFKQIDPKS